MVFKWEFYRNGCQNDVFKMLFDCKNREFNFKKFIDKKKERSEFLRFYCIVKLFRNKSRAEVEKEKSMELEKSVKLQKVS